MEREDRSLSRLADWTDQEVQEAYNGIENKDSWEPGDMQRAEALLRELNKRQGRNPERGRSFASSPPIARPAKIDVDHLVPCCLSLDDINTWSQDQLAATMGFLLRKADFSATDKEVLDRVQSEIWRRQSSAASRNATQALDQTKNRPGV